MEVHINYQANKDLHCSNVHNIKKTDQCDWVINSDDCQGESSAYINYVNLIFCTMSSIPAVGQIIILFIWLTILFTVLGTTANNFFCPALTVLAKLLRMSESIAGVTILAFSNGSSDIFTTLAGLPSGHSELIFSHIIGGGIFVTTVVVGLICIFYPFQINGGHFLRDSICYLTAVIWTFFIFRSGQIGALGTSGFLVLYIVYITVVLFTRKLKRKHALRDIQSLKSFHAVSSEQIHCKDSNTNSISVMNSDSQTAQPMRFVIPEIQISPPDDEPQESTEAERNEPSTEILFMTQTGVSECHGDSKNGSITTSSRQPSPSSSPSLSEALRQAMVVPFTPLRLSSTGFDTVGDLAIQAEHILKLSMMNEVQMIGMELRRRTSVENLLQFNRPQGLFSSFLFEMNPFLIDSWNNKKCLMKILAVLQAPVLLLLKFLIPVVNLTSLNHGWCKLLNVLQCTTMPLMCVFVTGVAMQPNVFLIPIWTTVTIVGLSLSATVFFTSKPHKVPIYHDLFSLMGFVGSVLVIYLVANETVSILRAVGILLRISEGTLGLTILAWGNSIGDLTSNLAIAKAGYQKMGFAACFGGPLFGTLLGLGISSVYGMIRDQQPIKVYYGDLGPICILFLVSSILSSIIILPLLRFQARRSYGFYLLALYLMFVITVAVSELNLTN